MANTMTTLDSSQVIKSVFDEVNAALNVNLVAGSISISGVTVDNGAGAAAVNIQDGGNSITVDASSLPLPTGASTEATLSTLNGKVPSNLTVTSTRLLVDGSGVTQPVSGTVAATQSGTWTTNDTGFTASEFARNDYTGTSVSTSAYTQLIASTAAAYQEIEIFDSSGQTLKIAFGAAASEVDKFLVFPGGNGRIKRNIPSGTRISIKAVSATASVGEIDVNLYG